MLAILLGLFRLIWLFGRGHRAVALENLALRQQLAIYKHDPEAAPTANRTRSLVLGRACRVVEGLAETSVCGSP